MSGVIKWKIKFNAQISNILHIKQVEQYKYLGIVINEFHYYEVNVQCLADAANRALGSVINKYKSING